MKPKELKELMHDLDREHGCIPETLIDHNKERRKNRIKMFNPKNIAVVEYLQKNGIRFKLCEVVYNSRNNARVISDIFLFDYNAVVRFYDQNNEEEVSKLKTLIYSLKRGYQIIRIFRNAKTAHQLAQIDYGVKMAFMRNKEGFEDMKLKPKSECRQEAM